MGRSCLAPTRDYYEGQAKEALFGWGLSEKKRFGLEIFQTEQSRKNAYRSDQVISLLTKELPFYCITVIEHSFWRSCEA